MNFEIALPQIIIQTSAISRKRRIVDLVAAAAGVLSPHVRQPPRHKPSVMHDLRDRPCATSYSLPARFAVPDANRMSLHCGFAAESAGVSGVLC